MNGELLITVGRVCEIVLGVALAITFVRLILGPSLPDRVVALDLTAAIAVGLIVVDSIITGESAALDVAVIIALIAFVSTLAFARLVERGGGR